MKEASEDRKIVPPYIPFKTLVNFIDRLKVGIPNRVDKSLMGHLSGGMQSQLLSALKYLNLINAEGTPTGKLLHLVDATGDSKKPLLRKVLEEAYPFLFNAELDLKKITLHQLQEKFENEGASGDTTRKCMVFFMFAAKEAGIELSPHLKMKSPRSGRKARKPGPGNGERQLGGKKPQPDEDFDYEAEESEKWRKSLLEKFPTFDPAWPDDVKKQWFNAFKDLMEIKKKT